MRYVSDILRTKGREVWTVGLDETVYGALEQMASRDVGAVLVIEGDALAGIFSERDYARGVALEGKRSHDTKVSDLMTVDAITVQESDTVPRCMELMTDNFVRHLPVVESDRVVGIVSIGDVVKSVISEQEDKIRQLEDYITGKT